MLTIPDLLVPEHVLLDLPAASMEEAVASSVQLFRDDARVQDWPALRQSFRGVSPCRVSDGAAFGICLPHVRTPAVLEMVMSAARLETELQLPCCDRPIRYVFCIAVPQAVAAEYLRIVGALMRIFSDAEIEAAMHHAATRGAFVSAMARLETRL